MDRVRNHFELECWMKPGNALAPVQGGGSSGSASELAGHFAAAPERADGEILMDVQPQGAHNLRADEEHIEPEIFRWRRHQDPEDPSKDEIEKTQLVA